LIARDETAVEEILVTRSLRLGVLRLRGVAREDSLGLLKCSLKWPGIEGEEWRPLFDVLTCDRISTVATGSAVPTAGIVTGTLFETARAVTTGTGPPAPRPARPLPRPPLAEVLGPDG
jgi:hypothetical protein